MESAIRLPEPGEIFEGRFRIDGSIGEGGMGVVLRATHALMETPVAIKMLHPALTDQPASVARFLREARNAAAVRSEHVGRVLDVGRTGDGLPYIVMELLPGVDLAVVCAQKRLSVVEATTYMLQACVAVAEAHALGIVHRDLKPSNLFLTTRPDGAPLIKVFDFGISKRSGDDHEDTETITKTGMALGTPCYMAVEQIVDAKNVDERADIWSLGVMLYEMLSGRLPFEGDTAAAIMASVGSHEPPSLAVLCPHVPTALAELVQRCLQKDPEKRPPDVVALAAALQPFAAEPFRGLAETVKNTRYPPQITKRKTPAASVEAFRRVLEGAATVVHSPDSEKLAKPAAAAEPAPLSQKSIEPPPSQKAPASVSYKAAPLSQRSASASVPKAAVPAAPAKGADKSSAEKSAPTVRADPRSETEKTRRQSAAGPDYARRTYMLMVYVALLVTAAVCLSLWASRQPASAQGTSVQPPASTAKPPAPGSSNTP